MIENFLFRCLGLALRPFLCKTACEEFACGRAYWAHRLPFSVFYSDLGSGARSSQVFMLHLVPQTFLKTIRIGFFVPQHHSHFITDAPCFSNASKIQIWIIYAAIPRRFNTSAPSSCAASPETRTVKPILQLNPWL